MNRAGIERPKTLAEVIERTHIAPDAFAREHDSFLDDFYLAHGNTALQQAKLDAAPGFTQDPFIDAWMGAAGEHLAQRWGLVVPAWTRRSGHNRLRQAQFVPDINALKSILVVTSPPAFRSRLLFTGSEPLQRARFPAGEVMRSPLHWPPPGA